MSFRVASHTSEASVRRGSYVPSLTKRAPDKITLPKWILQLAHKINLWVCKVAPEVHPLLRELTRNKADPFDVMRELVYCQSGQAPKFDVAVLENLDSFQLYRLYKNLKASEAIFKGLGKYADSLKAWGTDDEEVDFFNLISSMHGTLEAMWGKLDLKFGEKKEAKSPIQHPADATIQGHLESALSATYNNALRGEPNPPKKLETELAKAWRAVNWERRAKRVKEQLQSIATELMAQGTVNRELLEDPLMFALCGTGLDAVGTPAKEAIDELISLRSSERRRLIEPLLAALRKDVEGGDYEQDLLDALANIKQAAWDREPALLSDLSRASTTTEFADAIHDLAWKFFLDHEDPEVFKSIVKGRLRLPEAEFTKDSAKRFLIIAPRLVLTGKSKLVWEAIVELVSSSGPRIAEGQTLFPEERS